MSMDPAAGDLRVPDGPGSDIDENGAESDDDELRLPADTLALLQSFLIEKKEEDEKFERLRSSVRIPSELEAEEKEKATIALDIADFREDWQSYDDDTAIRLAQEAYNLTPIGGTIACVSSPSAFIKLTKLDLAAKRIKAYVFEYDRRFNVYGDSFVFFDYNDPTALEEFYMDPVTGDRTDRPLYHAIDTIIADPPFLSDECWTKTAICLRWLSRRKVAAAEDVAEDVKNGLVKAEDASIIVATGRVMEEKIKRELGCSMTTFEPLHRGGLSNGFGCFTNVETPTLKWA
ncbi:EEF1A lysine methyltransferase 1 [Irineochytrium annulatum]|nr:EEF1A lysine methyltransferase 1 [Irineochytrium annulatum]